MTGLGVSKEIARNAEQKSPASKKFAVRIEGRGKVIKRQ